MSSTPTRRVLTVATVIDTVVIAAALIARIAVKRRAVAARRTNSRRRYDALTLTCRPISNLDGPPRRVDLAPGSVCVVLQTRCVASHRAASLIGSLDVDDCPVPWTIAIAGEPDDCEPLTTALRFTGNVVLCSIRWLEKARVGVPCGILVDERGKRNAIPLNDPLPALARLFESCDTADARRWFSKASGLARQDHLS